MLIDRGVGSGGAGFAAGEPPSSGLDAKEKFECGIVASTGPRWEIED
jgi:hypothetical protein